MFDDSLGFTTYNDFFKRRNNIKKQYSVLDDNTKRIYKMYLYSQRELSTTKVDMIWEFLNEPETSIFCPKVEQLKQYFSHELEEIEKNHLVGDEFEY